MARIKIRDRYVFFLACINFGDSFEKALNKSQMDLVESIIAHDNFLREDQRIKRIIQNNKTYKYMGGGHFRRIDKLGRFYCEINKIGVKKLGFIANPLKYIFDKGK